MGPSIALGWEKVLPWPGQPHCKKIQLHLVVQVIWRSRKKIIFLFSYNFMPWIPDRRIDSNPPEAWNMSKIEMEELDTNEDGIMEKFPIYVQNKAQRIPRPRDPQLVDPQPGCFGNGPGPMKVLLVLQSYVIYLMTRSFQLSVLQDIHFQIQRWLALGSLWTPPVSWLMRKCTSSRW